MLVLKAKDGDSFDVVHRSGEMIRIRPYDMKPGDPGRVKMAFDDDNRNFEVSRVRGQPYCNPWVKPAREFA